MSLLDNLQGQAPMGRSLDFRFQKELALSSRRGDVVQVETRILLTLIRTENLPPRKRYGP